ncbi:MAG: potassium channel family protein, partial [Hyphomicrobiales bacterium]
MLSNIAMGAALIFLTTAIHAGGMHLALGSAANLAEEPSSLWRRNHLIRVGRVVLIMYLVSIIEVLVWAAVYLLLHAIEGIERALYFSLVTFTTLGYGDVVLDSSRRLLASVEAVNGILMFGWSTAIVIA